jgi:hypothetical protein
MRYVGILVLAAGFYGAYDYLTSRPIDWPAGVMAADDPRQTDFEGGAPIERGDFQLLPRAKFSAQVRVLLHERYRTDDLADVSPLDFAVGWGPMSDSAVLEQLDISQSNRFYYWHYDEEPPIDKREIVRHSANWHLIPSSETVFDALEEVRAGEIVEIAGLLVDVKNSAGQLMRTSLSRDDAGPGACEVVLVEQLTVRYR